VIKYKRVTGERYRGGCKTPVGNFRGIQHLDSRVREALAVPSSGVPSQREKRGLAARASVAISNVVNR